MAQGKFITLEGLDGSGITTQVEWLRTWLEKERIPVFVTKEPTDGPAGALLRMALARRLVEPSASGESPPLSPETMALLFAADRVDHLHSEISPKLKQGMMVVCDRYRLSSFAYQGVELDIEWVKQINSKSLKPDLTVFLDVPVEYCLDRIHRDAWRSSEHLQLYEDPQRLTKVRENYVRFVRLLEEEGEHIRAVDGTLEMQTVHQKIVSYVRGVLGHNPNPGPESDGPTTASEQIASMLQNHRSRR
jgi:dTMP kinase